MVMIADAAERQQDDLRGVARQQVQQREDEQRSDQQRGHEPREALEQEEADGAVRRWAKGLL